MRPLRVSERALGWRCPLALLGAIVCAMTGCTRVLGIDDEYGLGQAGSGGSTGGVNVTGGVPSTGGTSPTPTGGTSTSPEAGGCMPTCTNGEKCCGTSCVPPSPEMGCSLTDCTPCPEAIPNTDRLCVSNECSARCSLGFVPFEGQCVLQSSIDASAGGGPGTGGTTGSGGSSNGGSGTGGVCNISTCPQCTDPLQGIVRCCNGSGQCACTWFSPAYCGAP